MTVSPSLRIGTLLWPLKAMAALSLTATGTVSNSSCLCASAMRVRQENWL